MQARHSIAIGTAAALAAPALAAEVNLKLALPQLAVAEYHRPYVAVWLEKAADQSFAGNLALWYEVKKRDNGGAKYLKDLRTWWRKSGHDMQTPIDGVSGATHTAGEYTLSLGNAKVFAALPAGDYEVVVESARENGGREVLRVPLQWPPKAAQNTRAQGDHELGAVSLEARP